MPVHYEYLPATSATQQELVLLHGWGCNREVWRPLLTLLRPWANLTLLDLPGCAPGSSLGKEAELAGLLSGILVCCPQQAVYVGWSLGGQVALELAAQEPQRVLAVVTVCSNPSFVAADDWPGMGADAFSQFRSGVQCDPVTALQRFDTLQVKGATQPRQLLRQLRRLRQPASAELLAGLGWLQMLDQRDLLATLQQPQLHLLAARDALVPSAVGKFITSRLGGASSGQVKVLQRSCHLAPLDAPVELAQEICGFLTTTGKLRKNIPVAAELAKKTVAASFSRAAAVYDSVAHVQREVGERLLTRLKQWQRIPATILDLGCGTGYFYPALRERYPQAQYLGLDLASGMVNYARGRCCADDCTWLVADAEALPLASESIDLVFSSLAVQWCDRPEHLFAELARVLRPGGCCVFTTLGPDTLCELRAAWAAVDSHQHVNTFLPMAELAAAARRIPGIAVNLERQVLPMAYTQVRDLLDELKALGAHNMNRDRRPGLTSRRALQGMLQAYEAGRRDGVLPATYELIFGVVQKP